MPQDPNAAGPPGTPPPPQPTAPLGPSDPYHAPPGGYDPSVPVTAVPMNMGNPPSGPGGPPPGFGVSPPPPQKNGNTGWIIGGVLGVVLILVAVVVTLAATGAFLSDDTRTASDESTGEPTATGDPTDEESPSNGPGGGQYAYSDSLCGDVNLDPYLNGMKSDSPLDLSSQIGDTGFMSCGYSLTAEASGDFGFGFLSVTASTYPNAGEAAAAHDSQKDFSLVDGTPQELAGNWENGEIIIDEDSQTGGTDVGIYILDGNLSMRIELTSSGVPYARDARDMVVATTEEILGLLAN